jgi:hypothetical protein
MLYSFRLNLFLCACLYQMMLGEFDFSPDRFHAVSAVHEAEIEIFISRNTVYSTQYWWVWKSVSFGTIILIFFNKIFLIRL